MEKYLPVTNYNMIDNVLNNLPQDPEEKKEPAPQKEMRIAAFRRGYPLFFVISRSEI